MRFLEIASTVHETVKYTINVNKIFWKWKIISAQKLPVGYSNVSCWWYYLTETYLWKNFVPKSKMATVTAIMGNYEIGHKLKTIQVRDPYFQGYRMQWNYDFHSEITATTTKSNVVAVVAITPNYEIGHNLKSMQINLFVCVCVTF